MGCDSLVALPAATRDGATLFAKNSDRPPRECQRVVQLPVRTSPAGATVRCQHVEIPDVPRTAAILGSQPWWLWGLEHGVNEHRVAIGNETVFAKETLGPTGLLGMDLVRLGLERGRTATEALEVVTTLVERYGQGGSGHADVDWPYHNGFLIADPTSAWILETSGRHWAARPVTDVGNVSNGLAIGRDWERAAADVGTFATAQGWWPADGGRVDFAAAYADDTGVPPNVCRARRARAAALLAEGRGQLTSATLRLVLRDHFDAGLVHRPRPFEDEHFFSLCMHADPLDNTTASMVVRLPAEPAAVATAWVSLGSPCVGAFLPAWLEGTVPSRLGRGGREPDPESPWWQMRAILSCVERDCARLGPLVRARWDEHETALVTEVAGVEAEAEAARRTGRADDARAVLTACMERAVARHVERAAELLRQLESV
jgi:dipeptidase